MIKNKGKDKSKGKKNNLKVETGYENSPEEIRQSSDRIKKWKFFILQLVWKSGNEKQQQRLFEDREESALPTVLRFNEIDSNKQNYTKTVKKNRKTTED